VQTQQQQLSILVQIGGTKLMCACTTGVGTLRRQGGSCDASHCGTLH